MNKNRTAVFLLLLLCLGILPAFEMMDNSGQAGKTGSPGEATCQTTCHNSNTLNDGIGSVTISSDMPNWEYMTGDTYNISVTVTRAGISLFGFGLECLDGSSPNQNAGVFLVTNSAETQIKNATVNSVVRKNMVHKYNGGIGSGTKTFSFKWIAPATNLGNITFYAAGNAANGNNLASGDFIYTATQVATPALGASVIENTGTKKELSIFPNPVHDRFNLKLETESGETVRVSLYSIEGKEIALLYEGETNGNSLELSLSLPENIPAGLYFIRTNKGHSGKLLVE